MATISQARNCLFPAMPVLWPCIHLPHTMAPTFHGRLLRHSLHCVSDFSAKQGGASSGFAGALSIL